MLARVCAVANHIGYKAPITNTIVTARDTAIAWGALVKIVVAFIANESTAFANEFVFMNIYIYIYKRERERESKGKKKRKERRGKEKKIA